MIELDKYEDEKRARLISLINEMCLQLDVDPWELDCFSRHTCDYD